MHFYIILLSVILIVFLSIYFFENIKEEKEHIQKIDKLKKSIEDFEILFKKYKNGDY